MTTITESFNTSNGDTLGPDLTWTEVDGDWDIVSNAAELISNFGSTTRDARAEHDLASADHYAQASILQSPSGSHCGVCVRFSSSAETFYAGVFAGDAFGGTYTIWKVSPVSRSSLATFSEAATHPFTLRLEVEDDGSGNAALTLYKDGVSKVTHTDSTSPITGNTRCGIYGYDPTGSGSSSPRLDSFEAGDLGGGGGGGHPAARRLLGRDFRPVEIGREGAWVN